MTRKDGPMPMRLPMNRRRFLGLGAAALACPFLSRIPSLAFSKPLPLDRTLSFFNTHTEESADVAYFQAGFLVARSLEKIDYILRDHRSGEISPIDVRLLDLLHSLSQRTGRSQPFHVISGFRSARTNALLHQRGNGVARNSLHVLGQAVDIRVPGLALSELYRAAISLKGGGVGLYPGSNFVHVDVGRVRTW